MTKAELLKQKLEIAKVLANVKTPNEPSLSYDSGWKEPETVSAPAASGGDKPSAQDILAAIRNRK